MKEKFRTPTFQEQVRDVLQSMLCVINGLEGVDDLRWRNVKAQRKVYEDFFAWIGGRPEFQDNEALKLLDDAFTGAGWEEQGLRWTAEDSDDPPDIFVVEFTNRAHNTWKIV